MSIVLVYANTLHVVVAGHGFASSTGLRLGKIDRLGRSKADVLSVTTSTPLGRDAPDKPAYQL